jgi:predicted MPP superfamily phosphohydrolase
MNRRKFLSAAGVAGVGTLAYTGLFEPEWIEFNNKQVVLPGLQPGASIRLLHIADLHASLFVPMFYIERAIEMCVAARPDLICVTGDFVTTRGDFDNTRYIRALQRLAKSAPCFAVLGNHDGGHWARSARGYDDTSPVRQILKDAGIRLLHNQSELLDIRGAKMRLAGVGDLWARELDCDRAFCDADRKTPVVLMAHNPDSKEDLAGYPWELMLSGHTHGGQVVLPWWGPRFAPVRDKRYVAGLKPWGLRQIHVTRGVGSISGVRFQCRPEASVLELLG